MYSNKYGCCLVSPLVLYPALLCGGTVLCWFYTFILLQRAEHQVYTKAFAESWNISQVHSHIRPLVTCATNVHYLHDYFKSLWDISTIGTPVITCNLKSLLILWSTGFFSFCYSSKVSSRHRWLHLSSLCLLLVEVGSNILPDKMLQWLYIQTSTLILVHSWLWMYRIWSCD